MEPAPTGSGAASGQHLFCGSPEVDTRCVNCWLPLLQYAVLDPRDPRVGLDPARQGRLPLLFCWTCNVAQDEFHYRISPTGAFVLLSGGGGGVELEFPYEHYPRAFPAAGLELLPISDEDQALIAAANRGEIVASALAIDHPGLAEPRHQLGGEPLHRGGTPSLRCASCGMPMKFLAAFGDTCLDPRGFTGNPFVQVLFHLCRPCNAIGVHQVCD